MRVAAAAATSVTVALTGGGYSDDAELAFIQCFLQDDRLRALLRVCLITAVAQHGAILIIFPLSLQTSIAAQTRSTGGEGELICQQRTPCCTYRIVQTRKQAAVD